MQKLPLFAMLLALGSPALARESGQQMLERALKGRTPGAPVSCISLSQSPHSTIIDESTVLYRTGPIVYLQKFPGGCPGLRRDAALVTRTPSTQLCRGDIVTVIDPPMPGIFGSCALNDFIPYRRR